MELFVAVGEGDSGAAGGSAGACAWVAHVCTLQGDCAVQEHLITVTAFIPKETRTLT